MSFPDVMPSISVLVCTRNRAARLSEMLAALENLDLTGVREFEVAIVDNGSSDSTHALVQAWVLRTPLRARVLEEKRTGVSRAKNKAVRLTSSDLIICTDDDCLPTRDWIQNFLRAFDGNLMQLIGGRVELYNTNDAEITTKITAVPDRLASTAALLGFVHGCNMAFGRGLVNAIGQFDIRLGPGTGCFAADDTDFVYRAFAAGFPVRYEPGPTVYHNHGRSRGQDYLDLMAKYHFSFGAMAMKHLLRGRSDLIRPLYWAMRRVVRDSRAGVHSSEMVRTVPCFALGAFYFLVHQSWRRAE